MVRVPLTPAHRERGERLGRLLRESRADRSLADVAGAAGISAETLRKIETGRLPSPGFGTIVCLGEALNMPVQELAGTWRGNDLPLEAVS